MRASSRAAGTAAVARLLCVLAGVVQFASGGGAPKGSVSGGFGDEEHELFAQMRSRLAMYPPLPLPLPCREHNS